VTKYKVRKIVANYFAFHTPASKPIFHTFALYEIMCGFISASQQDTAKFRSTKPCGAIYYYVTNYRNAQNYQKVYKNKNK